MRIVDVSEFYSPAGGGVRSYVDRKMALLAEAGHEMIVLAAASEDRVEARADGGTVIWIRSPAMPFDPNYRMHWDAAPVHAWLDRLQPDVVEATSPWRPAWIVGSWHGRAVRSFLLHGDMLASYPRRWLGPIMPQQSIDRAFDWFNGYLNRIAARFGGVTVGGTSLAARLEERGVGPVRCVPMGIDASTFSPGHRDPALRAELLAACSLPPTATLLVGVGRHHSEKRWPLVIAGVQAAAIEKPIGLVIVGGGVDEAAAVRAAAGSPHVRLLPATRDRAALARLLASADALVHGCESETFGMVVAEALASGTPLIVPDEGGCADFAQGPHAACYRAGDRESLSAAVLSLLARDPAELRRAAAAAARAVRSDREHALDLVDLYGAAVPMAANA